jgi:hypothetical protein
MNTDSPHHCEHHCARRPARHWRRQLIWGILLIVFGTGLLLDHLDIIEIHSMQQYWPLLLSALGVAELIGATSGRKVRHGLWLIFLGGWVYISLQHIWGLSFQTSWPMLLVAWGIGLILTPLLFSRLDSTAQEHNNEK